MRWMCTLAYLAEAPLLNMASTAGFKRLFASWNIKQYLAPNFYSSFPQQL